VLCLLLQGNDGAAREAVMSAVMADERLLRGLETNPDLAGQEVVQSVTRGWRERWGRLTEDADVLWQETVAVLHRYQLADALAEAPVEDEADTPRAALQARLEAFGGALDMAIAGAQERVKGQSDDLDKARSWVMVCQKMTDRAEVEARREMALSIIDWWAYAHGGMAEGCNRRLAFVFLWSLVTLGPALSLWCCDDTAAYALVPVAVFVVVPLWLAAAELRDCSRGRDRDVRAKQAMAEAARRNLAATTEGVLAAEHAAASAHGDLIAINTELPPILARLRALRAAATSGRPVLD